MRTLHYEQEANLADDHWWFVSRRRIIEKIMRQLLAPSGGRELLEVGCGSGFNLLMLERFGRVEALEMSISAAKRARARAPRCKIDVGVIPMDLARKYDAICLFVVLEHIEDEAMALRWISDHLRPGGQLFLTVPAYRFLWTEYDVAAHHFRRYTRSALVASVQSHFSVDYATYFNTHLFPIVAAVRVIRHVLGLKSGERDSSAGATGVANVVLKQIFSSELIWLPRFRLPFGVSIFLAARKAA